MTINSDKTEVVHFCEQGRVPESTAEEVKAVCKHTCPHVGCDKVFFNKHGLHCHAGKCKWKQWFVVERILDTRWTNRKREFKIRWSGYAAEHDTWEPRENLSPGTIHEFLKSYGNSERIPQTSKGFF